MEAGQFQGPAPGCGEAGAGAGHDGRRSEGEGGSKGMGDRSISVSSIGSVGSVNSTGSGGEDGAAAMTERGAEGERGGADKLNGRLSDEEQPPAAASARTTPIANGDAGGAMGSNGPATSDVPAGGTGAAGSGTGEGAAQSVSQTALRPRLGNSIRVPPSVHMVHIGTEASQASAILMKSSCNALFPIYSSPLSSLPHRSSLET